MAELNEKSPASLCSTVQSFRKRLLLLIKQMKNGLALSKSYSAPTIIGMLSVTLVKQNQFISFIYCFT